MLNHYQSRQLKLVTAPVIDTRNADEIRAVSREASPALVVKTPFLVPELAVACLIASALQGRSV